MLVGQLRSAVADDEIAIGSVADRCLLSGVKQKSHFEGVRTVFDPKPPPCDPDLDSFHDEKRVVHVAS